MLKINMVTALIFVCGLALGSFVNALVWRTRELDKTKSKAKRKKLSPLTGRSMCTSCGHELRAIDLMPVISWVTLKGKCRYCKKAISWQYPFVELLTASVFTLSYLFWPHSLMGASWVTLVTWLLLATVLIALVVYDQKWMELPDSLVLTASILAVIHVGLLLATEPLFSFSSVVSAVWAAALLFSFFYVLFQVSKGAWIGGGDVKLAPALGLIAGSPLGAVLLLFIASLLGTLIGIPMMLIKKNKRHIKLPFGPLLVVGTFVVYFAGQNLLDWYTTHALYL